MTEQNKFDFLVEAEKIMNAKQCGSTIATIDGANFFKVGEGPRKSKPWAVKVVGDNEDKGI